MRSKYILLLLCFIIIGKIQAQGYSKLPTDTNYFWKQESCSYRYQIRYFKDTVIAGKIYNKYSLFGSTEGAAPCVQTFFKNGFLRQDSLNKKVCILDANFTERPLYNFNKVAGDTLLIYDKFSNTNLTYTVQSVNGGFQTLVDNSPFSYFVQEGIGSLMGGLYASKQPVDSPYYAERLICFGKIAPFQDITPPEVGYEGQCYLITGIKTSALENWNIKIYPNPFIEKIIVEFSNSALERTELIITDTFGQAVYSAENLESGQETDLARIEAGMYFIKLQNAFGQRVFKVLKE